MAVRLVPGGKFGALFLEGALPAVGGGVADGGSAAAWVKEATKAAKVSKYVIGLGGIVMDTGFSALQS